jgi:pseudouridine-5'-phosphate glycosidase/pseudouridine kinase
MSTPTQVAAKLFTIGSTNVDITAQAYPETANSTNLGAHSTLPGTVSLSLGGVSRNIAEAAYRVLSPPDHGSKNGSPEVLLVSALAHDSFGRLLKEESSSMGMRTDGLMEAEEGSGARTAVCNMVLDGLGRPLSLDNGNIKLIDDLPGGLTGGIADMEILTLLQEDKVCT